MSHKLGICIPYRNRKNHLDALVPALTEHLNKQGIAHQFYVAHQVDDKLFNRGAMKNIAAKHAFEDGCDYIAWHDVDMVPFEECDYSYPDKHPVHIATKLSKYGYTLGYDQYFGGVVLFTKEQMERTNGYSNEYWDWGQEDDDLFWRCHFEGYSNNSIFKSYNNKPVAVFDGKKSFSLFSTNQELTECLSDNHTISILFSAEQQPGKVPIWLVGDEKRKFVEYPLIRKKGSWTWGLSFNNSRSVNMSMFDIKKNNHYNYAKKFENEWTWITMSFNNETKEMYFYVNDELVTNRSGSKENKPFIVGEELMKHNYTEPFIIGFCNETFTFYKGKIGHVKIFNKFIDKIEDTFNSKDGLIFDCDFSNGFVNNVNETSGWGYDVEIENESFDVTQNLIPQRREGRFFCMEHKDEGFVNGKWAKGETTAKNEKRFVTKMQQGKIDYKNEGMNSLKYEVNSVSYEGNVTMINVTL